MMLKDHGEAMKQKDAAAQSLMSLKPPYLPSVAFYGFRLVPFASCAKSLAYLLQYGIKRRGYSPAALYCRELFPFLQYGLQFHQPFRAVISHGEKLAVFIAGNFYKAVLVIEEGCLVAIVQNAAKRFKTLREAS